MNVHASQYKVNDRVFIRCRRREENPIGTISRIENGFYYVHEHATGDVVGYEDFALTKLQ